MYNAPDQDHSFQSSHSALREAVSKVPEITSSFRIIKIAATTLGESGGDWVTMS